MKAKLAFIVLASQSMVSLCAFGGEADDSWQNLSHVTRERYYTVVDRKSNCSTGHILTANDHAITLKLPDATTVTLDRSNVLRVSVSQAAPNFPPKLTADVNRVRDAVYNDKSSWFNINGLAPLPKARNTGPAIRIVKKNGQRYEGQLVRVSETDLEMEKLKGTVNIPKADISKAYYLRYKPLTDSAKYSAQEDFWIDPRLWPYYLHLSVKIPVLLYDSLLPEDDAALKCANVPQGDAGSPISCFVGEVKSIDLPNMTILQANGKTKTLYSNTETSITKRQQQIKIGDIKVGDRVVACVLPDNGSAINRISVTGE